MEKMLKVPLMMIAVTLTIFLAAGTASANCCDANGNGVCDAGVDYFCGDVVMADCTLVGNMNCGTRHGLIIGAAGVTIDGAGFTLDGGGVGRRNCAVNVGPEEDPDRLWCVGHPCRRADVTPADNDPRTFDGCLDSGIINARTTLGGGVDPAVPMCEGGFDDVTVKNLQITNWCDGIFMSGDCESSEDWRGVGNCFVNPVGGLEYRLTGLLIEGNHIYENGNDECGNYTPAAGGDGGDWDRRFYNDAIFTAEIGMDSANCDVWELGGGLPAEGGEAALWRWGIWWKMAFDLTPPCQCVGPSWICRWADCELPWWNLSEIMPPSRRCFPNRIVHNVIADQKGCGCVACAGANGINLQGGLEVGEEPEGNSGANEIGKNYIAGCSMSGIQYTHATKHNRIHGNFLIKNMFGGITDPCGWCHDSYIFDNRAEGNMGVNIATNAMSIIVNNECFYAQVMDANDERRELGYPAPACDGTGILVGGDGAGSVITGNTSCDNSFADIFDGSLAATGDENKCDLSMGFAPGCKYKCWNLPW